MLKKITFIDDQMTPETWVTVETEDVFEALQERFKVWPDFARLYDKQVAVPCDVTPTSEEDYQTIRDSEGPFFVVLKPGELTTIAYLIIAAVIVVAVVAFKPKVQAPIAATRNIQTASPNNSLSGRTNQVRLNGRIPDIYGTVRSTPDLVAMPYTVFDNHIECEYCYMCIGRGYFCFPGEPYTLSIRDGDTLVEDIAGSVVEIYDPFTSPNTGASPRISIGGGISRPVISAKRSKSVNGQVLLAPNDEEITGETNFSGIVSFVYPNVLQAAGAWPGDFTTQFNPGDTLSVSTSNCSILAYQPVAGGELEGSNVFDWFASFGATYSARFNVDGRCEIAGLTVGLGNAHGGLLGQDDGYGYIEITMGPSSGTVLDMSGKYIVTGSNEIMNLLNANFTAADMDTIAGFGLGGWTSFASVTFNQPQFATLNYTGVYQIDSVSAHTITLVNDPLTETPGQVNSGWAWRARGITMSPPQPASIIMYGGDSEGTNWIGPYTLDVATLSEIISNFVAVQGMYKDNGTSQIATSVTLEVEVTPVDVDGNPTSAPQLFGATIVGSAVTRDQRAVTLFGTVSAAPTRVKVRARRVTPKDLDFDGQIADEVKWRDLYASSPVGNVHFGDVTTVHSLTQATRAALAVSERQLNILVRRKLYDINDLDGPMTCEYNAAGVLVNLCIDPKIGRMSTDDVDVTQIKDAVTSVEDYFGNDDAGQFNYTFDSDNMSPEEMINGVAHTIFSTAIRRGRTVQLVPEFLNPDSRLLFNHRNKLPGTENRTANFGNFDDNDGIELQYVSPVDDAILTFHVPEDQSATKPKKVETIGIRGVVQAHLHAYREYNKLRYKNTLVQFEATQEANDLAITDRILVADNTRPDIQDGNIEWMDGLSCKLSQPAKFATGIAYTMFVQYPSGNVASFPITAGDDAYHVTLGGTPGEVLVTADDAVAKCGYIIVRSVDAGKDAFLVESKTYGGNGNFTAKITGTNYDPRYYQNDQDFAP